MVVFCFDQEPITGPCDLSAYRAGWNELVPKKEGRHTVIEAATGLYNSVLFQNNQSFVQARCTPRDARWKAAGAVEVSGVHGKDLQQE